MILHMIKFVKMHQTRKTETNLTELGFFRQAIGGEEMIQEINPSKKGP